MLLNNPNSSADYPSLHQYCLYAEVEVEIGIVLVQADHTMLQPFEATLPGDTSTNLADFFEGASEAIQAEFQSAKGAFILNYDESHPVYVHVGNTRGIGTEVSPASILSPYVIDPLGVKGIGNKS